MARLIIYFLERSQWHILDFPEGGRQSRGEGGILLFAIICAENCMKKSGRGKVRSLRLLNPPVRVANQVNETVSFRNSLGLKMEKMSDDLCFFLHYINCPPVPNP